MNVRHHDHEDAEASAPEARPLPGMSGLPVTKAPQRDLWPGIESRIRAHRARRQQMPLWAGAGLAAALVLTLGLSMEHRTQRPPPLSAPPDLAALTSSGRALHPETRALVRANLKLVNNAESELRRALEQDPDGEYLRSLLAAARQQKQALHVVLADAHADPREQH